MATDRPGGSAGALQPTAWGAVVKASRMSRAAPGVGAGAANRLGREEQARVLHASNVEVRLSLPQATRDLAVKVFIGQQPLTCPSLTSAGG